jgi:hypothetical protein
MQSVINHYEQAISHIEQQLRNITSNIVKLGEQGLLNIQMHGNELITY